MAASSGKAAASFAASSVSVGAKGIFIALFIVVGVHSRCSHFMHTHQNQTQKHEGQDFTLKNRNSSAVSLNAIILTRPRERARRPLALGRALGLA
jgi:hypothetical protein